VDGEVREGGGRERSDYILLVWEDNSCLALWPSLQCQLSTQSQQ